jgi:Yip1 domain
MEGNEIQSSTNETNNPTPKGSFWNIFLEPAKCFEALNLKPVFVVPLILCILISFANSFVILNKMDMAQVMRTQLESSPAADQMEEEQIAEQIQMMTKFAKISVVVVPLIFIPLLILLLSGLIMLGIYVTGSETVFRKVLAVATSSMLFYSVVSVILFITVVLVSADPNSINLQNPVFTNPAGLVDLKESKVLYTFLSHLDVLVWYTIYLIGLGLSKVATKCSVAKGVCLIGFWYVIYALVKTGFSAIF